MQQQQPGRRLMIVAVSRRLSTSPGHRSPYSCWCCCCFCALLLCLLFLVVFVVRSCLRHIAEASFQSPPLALSPFPFPLVLLLMLFWIVPMLLLLFSSCCWSFISAVVRTWKVQNFHCIGFMNWGTQIQNGIRDACSTA